MQSQTVLDLEVVDVVSWIAPALHDVKELRESDDEVALKMRKHDGYMKGIEIRSAIVLAFRDGCL